MKSTRKIEAKPAAVRQRTSTRLEPRSEPQSLHWVLPVLIACTTFIVFIPALQNGFVDWDDYQLIVQNPDYRGLGWKNLLWMFTNFQSLYRPLTWMSLGMDYLLWGMNPWGYHLTSVLIHTVNAVLFYYLAHQVLSLTPLETRRRDDTATKLLAAFAALVFAVHPLRVEAVAWVSARNDVLSASFFLLTLICYLEYAKRKRDRLRDTRIWFAAAIGAYACSLLSKASAVTLPLVLLLLDVNPLQRIVPRQWFTRAAGKLWWEKLPFFLLAAATAAAALAAKSEGGAVASLRAHSIASRIAQSFYGLAFYVWKTLFPTSLSPFYELPPHLNPFAAPVLLSAVAVTALTALFVMLRKRWPAVLANWIYYVLLLLPVIGFVQNGRQIVADRYSYLACLGWALLVAAGVRYAWNRIFRDSAGSSNRFFASATGGAVVAMLAVLTWLQLPVWHDTDTLWNHVLAVTDRSAFRSGTAHHVVARILADRGDLNGAIKHLRSSIDIEPSDSTTYADLGTALARQGKLTEASDSLQRAISLNPNLTVARVTLGKVFVAEGQLSAAAQEFETALRIDPSYAAAYHNLGKVLAAEGLLDNAIELFRTAVRIEPRFVEARQSLALALDEKSKHAGN